MPRVGIREFKDNATKLLASGEMLIVERHGQSIGYFVPLEPKDPVQKREAWRQFREVMREAAQQAGMTEEELAEEMLKE